MKEFVKLVISVSFFSFLLSCSQEGMDQMEATDHMVSKEAVPANEFISSSAAVETGTDTVRKFIRTADLQFKVKSVVLATYQIENIVSRFDGFVIYTKLNSNSDRRTSTAVSEDSTLETLYFTVTNSMKIRVPNTQLDTTLKSIARLIDYLDYRIIKADDVRFRLLSNKLTQRRVEKHEQRLEHAIDERGKKLKETIRAEENLAGKQEQADKAMIANLSLQDQIDYSTINLSIYQRQGIKRWLVANDKNIEAYQPGLGARLLEALKFGWRIIENILVALTKLWTLIALGLLLFILYRKFRHRLKF